MAEKESAQVQRWHDRISVSKRWKEDISNKNGWEDLLDELKGRFDVVLGNNYVPPINEMFAYRDTMVSNLLARDPYIAVNAQTNASILKGLTYVEYLSSSIQREYCFASHKIEPYQRLKFQRPQ